MALCQNREGKYIKVLAGKKLVRLIRTNNWVALIMRKSFRHQEVTGSNPTSLTHSIFMCADRYRIIKITMLYATVRIAPPFHLIIKGTLVSRIS